MCLGVPGRIVELSSDRPDFARADVGGRIRDVHLGLLAGEPPAPGDWIVVHMGFALERMTEAEARDALAFLDGEEAPAPVTPPADGSLDGPHFPPRATSIGGAP